jgi:hypothetical protein
VLPFSQPPNRPGRLAILHPKPGPK